MRWIAGIKMAHPAQQIALQEYVGALTECTRRVERLTEQIQQLLPQWRMAPVAKAYQSLRGVSLIVAATTVADQCPVRLILSSNSGPFGRCLRYTDLT